MTGILQQYCQLYRDGKLDPRAWADATPMLCGEGLKRLESFVFELLFQRALTHYCSDWPVAYGWYVLPYEGRDAGLWVRLVTENGLNTADHALIAKLRQQHCLVLKVARSEDGKGFSGSWLADDDWCSGSDLAVLLRDRFGDAGNIRQPKPSPPDRTDAIITALQDRLTASELESLVLSRLLINGYLVPYTGSQPMDLDAVLLNDHRILKFSEFKRKYPARDMVFGVDTHPHAALVDWLDQTGSTLSNIVLIDPLRDKSISPLYMLDPAYRSCVRWVGCHLDPSVFDQELLKTEGTDSGMYSFTRHQKRVRVDRYSDLGTGFSPRGLRSFLDDEILPSISVVQLNEDTKSVRQKARSV